ncbi:16S rRNA (uracil(1498)-N(3))-methyltransferase [Metamycoplasma phocicerebrale]|uniref:Ribosomal RNA small subunit methyltransferase E n=1 Tax=Metamycoplasma phocicerebrale TaxID=142649 RepID=A0A3T0TUB1_9BACT|nr:16S rRNA (uracil(1498)-N(3))-methyltransferase [Metamycoplasma phocicerebrale]AZZ65546.1 16S rRNA (uracil(1498)-N(3))-methyltransferase [Metamycoplasma phocicerebrale]
MYKFFSKNKIGNAFELDLETQKHLKVIRIKNQDFLINHNNEFYLCNYEFPNKAIIKQKLNINNELDFKIVVAIPLIKHNHFEIALQKAVELGATTIIPFISEYCDKGNINIENKILRFKKIIQEASQQSFRNIIPKLEKTLNFEELINYPIKNKILAYENEKDQKLNKINEDAILIVGPEGGFSQQEIAKAKLKNIQIVSLTKTILRAETALIYMMSKIL